MLAIASHIIRSGENETGSNSRRIASIIITTDIIISVAEFINAASISERLKPKVCLSVASLFASLLANQ
jgi:fucose permease